MVKLNLLLLLFATAFLNLNAMQRLRDAMHWAGQNPVRAGAVTCTAVAACGSLYVAYCSYYNEMTLQNACQEPDKAVKWIQDNPIFATSACTSAMAMNGTIKNILSQRCKQIVEGSQKLSEWWNSSKCRTDDTLKTMNVARQCEVEKHFSERLDWEIETLGSSFFSTAIYDHFKKFTHADQYQAINAELETKLQAFFAGMKTSKSLKVKIYTLQISSHDEQNQGDWGVFNIDVEHEGKMHFYTVVAFKGTNFESIKDLIADANQNLVTDDLLETAVPEGFFNNLAPVEDDFFPNKTSLEAEILMTIAQDRSSQQRNIIITGHSLGGALAKLMGTRIKSDAFLNQMKAKNCTNLVKAIKDAKVYTYGAPQIFQKEFNLNLSKDESYLSNFIHFIADYDPVPQLQVSSRRKTYCKLLEIKGKQNNISITCDDIDFSDFGHIIIIGESCEGENCSSLWSTKLAQETIEKLREIAQKRGVVTGIWYHSSEHRIENYIKKLKNYINVQYD